MAWCSSPLVWLLISQICIFTPSFYLVNSKAVSGRHVSSVSAHLQGIVNLHEECAVPPTQSLFLHSDDNGLMIRSTTDLSQSISLSLSNQTSVQVSLHSGSHKMWLGKQYKRYVAIFGFYRLPLGYYIAMVKKSSPLQEVSSLGSIHRVEQIELVRIPSRSVTFPTNGNLSLIQDHQRRMKQLLHSLNRHQFLFSTGSYDILHSLESNRLSSSREKKREEETEAGREGSEGELDGGRFFWNEHVIQLLDDPQYRPYITKFVNAYVYSSRLEVLGKEVDFLLLARRSKRNQGPRYMKRGSDCDGEVANFVEIEQIVSRPDGKARTSFVQIRGSIPLHWSQPTPWKMKPEIVFKSGCVENVNDVSHEVAMKSHLSHLVSAYRLATPAGTSPKPQLFLINLIDKKGDQDRNKVTLRDFETRLLQRSERPLNIMWRYLWMDYHYKVKHDGVKATLNKLHGYLETALNSDRAFFLMENIKREDKSTFVKRSQTNLIRTNCVDCLDRTNVIQTTVSRWVLMRQVAALYPDVNPEALRILKTSLHLPNSDAERKFRLLWAELGDQLSILYAGSRAMKRDVTITGTRTRHGVMEDAISYVRRYYSNNYRDPQRQIALNTMLGMEEDTEIRSFPADIERKYGEVSETVDSYEDDEDDGESEGEDSAEEEEEVEMEVEEVSIRKEEIDDNDEICNDAKSDEEDKDKLTIDSCDSTALHIASNDEVSHSAWQSQLPSVIAASEDVKIPLPEHSITIEELVVSEKASLDEERSGSLVKGLIGPINKVFDNMLHELVEYIESMEDEDFQDI
eukprot:gene6469-7134_t